MSVAETAFDSAKHSPLPRGGAMTVLGDFITE
jgi:hypothetical protein